MSSFKKISFIALLGLLMILLPFVFVANFKPFYSYQFEKYDVYENFGDEYEEKELEMYFDDILKYMSVRKRNLSLDFFSGEDIIHMVDVRNLFLVLYISIVAFLNLLVNAVRNTPRKNFVKPVRIASLAVLGFIGVMSLLNYVLSFDRIFLIFHKTFFKNDYWLLDPRVSNLIKYFPQQIFVEETIFIGILITAFSLIGLFASFLLGKNYESKKE